MIIKLQVKPNARRTEILEEREGFLRVAVKAPPVEGKANLELLKFLKKHFKSEVRLVSGRTSKRKLISVD